MTNFLLGVTIALFGGTLWLYALAERVRRMLCRT
jgi:hypothetical protein